MSVTNRRQSPSPWPLADGEMARTIREFYWSATPLGPIENWPASLSVALDVMLGCAFPATLQWGRELILFYNDAYIPFIGSRHPGALGQPILATFPEIEVAYRPIAERVWSGERFVLKDQVFRYVRHETPEELSFDMSFSPVHGDDGSVEGILAIGLDTTARLRAEQAKAQTDLRLQRVLETDAVGVIFFDFSGTVVDANDVFLRMTGYSKEEIHSRRLTWRILTPPEWVSASEAEMEKLNATGRIGPYEKEYILKDGSRRWMLFAGRDLGDGTIAEYCIDVTGHRAAEAALRASEQRFRALVEATSDVVYRMNPHWTEMRLLHGRKTLDDTESPVLHWMDKYIHPDDQSEVHSAIQEAIRTRGIFQLEHRVLRADGSLGWTSSRAMPLLNTDGEIVEWFGTATDITLRKQAEEALLRSEKLASLGRLAASIAHEINNPLEAITNLLYLVRISEGLPEQAERNLELADSELKRIAHITRQSLGFYRETGTPSLTSVTDLLEASIDLLRGKIVGRAASIQRDWDCNLVVAAVPGELRQVFSNLLANSLDAITYEGKIRIRARNARSATHPDRQGVRITFSDNGRGIRRDLRAHIFDPFFTTKGNMGTGLGLWVTRQIVDKHGGQIRMRSCNDGVQSGTVFSVFIPQRDISA
jgi:PAS domain S-box-containing protein